MLTLAFVMDPLERVSPRTDTSFAFMCEAYRRGHRVVYVRPSDVGLRDQTPILSGRQVNVFAGQTPHFSDVAPVRLWATDCAAIFIRTDPPFDEAYLTVTWLLSFAERAGVRVLNSPAGLRAANEKLYTLEFAALAPPTLVTSLRDEVRAFVEELGGEAIAKPIDGHGGFAVVRLSTGDSNFPALVDMLTREGQQPLLVQKLLPGGKAGDKRLFVLDGELRAALMRVPREGDHRSNVHVGGRVVACEIDARDRALVATMSQRLRADGLYFVGLDVIDGMLTDVNVTSPTLVQELKRLGGPDLAAEVIDSVEKTARAK